MTNMLENDLTINDIETAYRKLKSMAYYDTHDLYLKSKIASFETGIELGLRASGTLNYELIDFQEKLDNLHQALTSNVQENFIEYWKNLYNKIDYRILPKKVKSYNDYNNKKRKNEEHLIKSVFTNIREIEDEENYEFDKLTFFFEAPVEIHIVSILWIMKLGYHLETDLHEKCYGNRLILNKKKANSTENKVTDDSSLFKPYYNQYQKWRDEGISVAKSYLENKQDVLFLNIDIKDYYYSIRFNFNDLEKRLENKQLEDYSTLSDVFKKIHTVYTEKLKKTKYPNDFIKNVADNETVLPIGLASSYILANWYLKDFDSRVHQNIRPIYYSRYVDDIFIITANPDPKFDSEYNCKNAEIGFDEKFPDSYFENLTIEEKHIIKTLHPVITLENTQKNY